MTTNGVTSVERFVEPDTSDLLAIVVRREFVGGKYNFFTPDDFPLQLGHNSYLGGERIQPHAHASLTRHSQRTQEFIFVKRGSLALRLFGRDGGAVATTQLRAGDCVLLISGGHGFDVLEDAQLVEVKQGPYLGAGDKVKLDFPS